MALGGQEPLKQVRLDVSVVVPVAPVTEILEAQAVPEQRDDTQLGLDFEVADTGHGRVDSDSRISQRPFLVGPT